MFTSYRRELIEDINYKAKRNEILKKQLAKELNKVNRTALDYYSVCAVNTLDHIVNISLEIAENSQDIYEKSQFLIA